METAVPTMTEIINKCSLAMTIETAFVVSPLRVVVSAKRHTQRTIRGEPYSRRASIINAGGNQLHRQKDTSDTKQ